MKKAVSKILSIACVVLAVLSVGQGMRSGEVEPVAAATFLMEVSMRLDDQAKDDRS